MLDAVDLIKAIQKTAKGTFDNSVPCNILFGTVTSVSPLEITIDQKIKLIEKQIILSRNVTEYNLEMSVDHATENFEYTKEHSHSGMDSQGGGVMIEPYTESGIHTHDYSGRKTFTVHNALLVGEKVILARFIGGQRFLVIDRIGE